MSKIRKTHCLPFIQLLQLIIFLLLGEFAQGQDLIWANAIGGSGKMGVYSVICEDDKLYSSGYFFGATDLDPGPGTSVYNSTGPADAYISRSDTSGIFEWGKAIHGTEVIRASKICSDELGNLYVAGKFSGIADFDPGAGTFNLASTGASDGFVLKLDTLGNFIWAYKVGGTGNDYVMDISVNASGVYVSGWFEGVADFDPSATNSNTTSSGLIDLFVQKVDPSGNLLWIYTDGTSQDDNLKEACLDNNGNIIITGYHETGSPTNHIIFIQKIDPTGQQIWERVMGGLAADQAWAVETDADNNIYTTGSFRSTPIDMDPGPNTDFLSSAGQSDLYINKMDENGNHVWAKSFPGPTGCGGDEIIMHPNGFLTVSGFFYDSVDFDPTPGQSFEYAPVGYDLFLVKLDTSGNVVWHGSLNGGSFSADYLGGMALDNSNGFYYAGSFLNTLDIDPGPQTNMINGSATNMNGFFAKLNPDPCLNFNVVIDSFSNLECTGAGYAAAHTIYSSSNDYYQWNTSPITYDSIGIFTQSGIYDLAVVNDSGCVAQTAISITGSLYQNAHDFNSQLIATPLQAGFPSTVWAHAYNDGCLATPGTYQLVLDTNVTFNSSIPPPDMINGDTLEWNVTGLAYGTTDFVAMVNFTTSVFASINDTVCFISQILPISGDADTSNNIKKYLFPVVAAYDPNDKKVFPQGECDDHYISHDDKLTYTIRCQNTGNAPAVNIHILDTISPNLDLASMRVVASSHPVIPEILPNNVINFRFDNIYLADSMSNEPESHGYVVFEIDQTLGLLHEALIENTVDIFFDFNPPIRTNTAFSTVQYCDSTILNSSINSDLLCLGDQFSSVASTSVNCQDVEWSILGQYFNNSNFDFVADTIGLFPLTVNIKSGVCEQDSSFIIAINDTSYSAQSVTICYGDSLFADGAYQSFSGIYIDSNISISGCDSTVVWDLTVLPPVVGIDNIVACQSHTWINGVTYTSSISSISHSIVGGAASGCDSVSVLNLTILPPSSGTDVIESCDPIVWVDGITYSSNTISAPYTIVSGAASGCDSIVTLDFTILPNPNTQVTQNNELLTANQNGATYQWINCGQGNTIVVGETNQSFMPTSNGSYAVIVNLNNCSDTSDCFTISTIGLSENEFDADVLLYPNPTSGKITIDLNKTYSSFSVRIMNAIGQNVFLNSFENTQKTELLNNFEPGIYFVSIIMDDTVQHHFKILKTD